MLTTIITSPDPFDFHLTASQQTHFRSAAGADVYKEGIYWRALRHEGKIVVASAASLASGQGSGLKVTVHGENVTKSQLRHAVASMSHMLGLDTDLVGFYKALESDPVLAKIAKSLYGMCPPRSESVFEALVVTIVSQQIASTVARLIRDGLVTTYGTSVESMGGALYAFPTPQALLEAGTHGLRTMRLSARKIEYLQDICIRTIDGSLSDARLRLLDSATVTAELLQIRGIGHWTSSIVQHRALGRPDVFPSGDLALAKLVSRLYLEGNPITEQDLGVFAREHWHPYEGLAATYLFAYLRQQRLTMVT